MAHGSRPPFLIFISSNFKEVIERVDQTHSASYQILWRSDKNDETIAKSTEIYRFFTTAAFLDLSVHVSSWSTML